MLGADASKSLETQIYSISVSCLGALDYANSSPTIFDLPCDGMFGSAWVLKPKVRGGRRTIRQIAASLTFLPLLDEPLGSSVFFHAFAMTME